ncbi:ROK family protein [Paenibacillus agricola]|uniref:ROK family protein n=1 Tax=Paenibacillus agricola TaxID=2716264 RepID=A0ABX0IZL8_9BACL|nr:ROK family protein [Paenibacillus agricola]NHN29327.1 ROK family protein [Paenibacillus agricola]
MAKSKGRGPTLAKDINRKLVYKQIKHERSTSRVGVAKQLQLNKNTVNSIVDELVAAGFVQEFGLQETNTAGRKPVIIRFNAQSKWAIGVQLTSTVMHWVVTDLYANPLDSFSVALASSTPEQVVAALLVGINRLAAQYSPAHCIGICLGIPGLMGAGGSKVIRSSHLGWHDVPILSMLQNKIDISIQLDNSVKLASLGELWHGSGQGLAHFVYAYFGNGVSSGIIIHETIFRGESNAAGELGHMIIDPEGPLCGCGNRGCLEALVSIPALLTRMGRIAEKAISLDWVFAELASGNPQVAAEFEQAGRYIGQALSYVVNLLNPKLIICDGPLMQASAYMFPFIEEELKSRCLWITSDQVTLVRSKLFPLASCIGAAASVIQSWEEGMDSFQSIE